MHIKNLRVSMGVIFCFLLYLTREFCFNYSISGCTFTSWRYCRQSYIVLCCWQQGDNFRLESIIRVHPFYIISWKICICLENFGFDLIFQDLHKRFWFLPCNPKATFCDICDMDISWRTRHYKMNNFYFDIFSDWLIVYWLYTRIKVNEIGLVGAYHLEWIHTSSWISSNI